MTWQPIETAPKDGTAVLAYLQAGPNKTFGVIWWDPGDLWITGGWMEAYGCRCFSTPIYWMPLPEPPEVPRG